jgi:hypothetical protein
MLDVDAKDLPDLLHLLTELRLALEPEFSPVFQHQRRVAVREKHLADVYYLHLASRRQPMDRVAGVCGTAAVSAIYHSKDGATALGDPDLAPTLTFEF